MTQITEGDWIEVDSGLTGLRSSQTFERLNQIDQVRANGVSDHISLPQLVVGGDQSAGKSSVLEGITGIPFPRQDGMCTRFATEIVLRHQPNAKRITATIIPGSVRSDADKNRLKGFRRELSNFSDLPDVIQEVATLMGIRGYTPFEDAPAFATDVLRLEYIGNTGLHLTVVDLPGLISVSDNGEKEIVEALVNSYLENSRTVILAVLQAGNDIETQTIIQSARGFDRAGGRTLGIITKPDLINKGTETRVASLSKNSGPLKLQLGFFLLKNPTPEQLKAKISSAERIKAESDFFRSSPWKEQNLNWSRVGIENLRIFLQELLNKHIERELPKVRKDIQNLLFDTERELLQVGAERSSPGQIRSYLSHVSMDFYNLVRSALEGNYDGEHRSFFASPISEDSARLRALVHQGNGDFAAYMRDHAQKRKLSRGRDRFDGGNGLIDQLLVTKAEFDGWVKQVRMLKLNTKHQINVKTGLSKYSGAGAARELQSRTPGRAIPRAIEPLGCHHRGAFSKHLLSSNQLRLQGFRAYNSRPTGAARCSQHCHPSARAQGEGCSRGVRTLTEG